jgi:hypothetical protein
MVERVIRLLKELEVIAKGLPSLKGDPHLHGVHAALTTLDR